MINGINAATPAPNTVPNVDNTNNDVQKNQEEESNVQAKETSGINLAEKAEQNEKGSKAETEETVQVESAQNGYEANAKAPAAQNESPGTILDILG